jgi:hypothetical protein
MMRLKLKYAQISFVNFKNWKNEASWSGWDQESRLKRAGSTQLSSIYNISSDNSSKKVRFTATSSVKTMSHLLNDMN